MVAKIDVKVGSRFGMLVVTALGWSQHASGRRTEKYKVLCDCGDSRDVWKFKLTQGKTVHCGCLTRKSAQVTATEYTTGETIQTGARKSWNKMWQRIRYAASNPHYVGITICARWTVFENFLEDMGERPEGMSIDRIDPAGNYEPSNCRWATKKEQSQNRKPWEHTPEGLAAINANRH